MNATYEVRTFHEVYSGPETWDTAVENLKTQIVSAGFDPRIANLCAIYHKAAGVFVAVATVMPYEAQFLVKE